MSSKKETMTTPATKAAGKTKRPAARDYSAAEKAQAVLAVWTERVKSTAVLRSLGISYVQLQQWQERAMEGMLQALEARVNLADGGALSPRLKALLQKREQVAGREKLSARLERLQGIASKGPPAQPV